LRTYHINHAAAGATVCGLRSQDCSFASEDEHYTTYEGAIRAYNDWLKAEGGFLEPENTRVDMEYLEELSVLLEPTVPFEPDSTRGVIGEVIVRVDEDDGSQLASLMLLENRQWYSLAYTDDGIFVPRLEDFSHSLTRYRWKRTSLRGDVVEFITDSWANEETIQLLADHLSMNRPQGLRWTESRESLVSYARRLLEAAESSSEFDGKKHLHMPEIVAELLYPEHGNRAYYSITDDERALVLHDISFFYDFLSTEAPAFYY